MIKKIRTIALATALLGTCAMADSKVEISGDAEVTYKSEKTGSDTNAFNETEVNLNFDITNEDGVEFHGGFTVFDGVQADDTNSSENEANMKTAEAYVIVPLSEKAKLTAGLKEDTEFGTEAFWSADAYWRTKVEAEVATDVTVYYEAKKINEEKQTDGKGDSDSNELAVEAKFGDVELGARYISIVENKDDADQSEVNLVGAYAKAKVSIVDLAVEYAKQSKDSEGQGIYVSAATELDNGLSAGIAYVTLSDGLEGGGDFAATEILDGNIDSSSTEDTSAVIIPLGYEFNDKFSANATLVSAKIQGDNATAYEVGFEYALGEKTTVSGVYSSLTGDGATTLVGDDQTIMAASVSVEF